MTNPARSISLKMAAVFCLGMPMAFSTWSARLDGFACSQVQMREAFGAVGMLIAP